ncbi:hypothetical protein Dcar01_01780 [Deinococcus carri]|uniref:HTH cro/C1-type domain-containing protein n=1 Tax=Deinococcus carri TaxID=1211323 RepID=A0ABP9W6R1_9DEIO
MNSQQSDLKLSGLLFQDSEHVLVERITYLKEYLSYVMKELRSQAELSQADIAEVLGVKQPAVAKLEKADRQHDIESVMRYLHAVGAELTVGVKRDDRFYQVSEPSNTVIVDVPEDICGESQRCQMDVRSYVHDALDHYCLEGQNTAAEWFGFEVEVSLSPQGPEGEQVEAEAVLV